jgi:hypothetical protein
MLHCLHLLLSSARYGYCFHRQSLIEHVPLKSPVGGYSNYNDNWCRDASVLDIEKSKAGARVGSPSVIHLSETDQQGQKRL